MFGVGGFELCGARLPGGSYYDVQSMHPQCAHVCIGRYVYNVCIYVNIIAVCMYIYIYIYIYIYMVIYGTPVACHLEASPSSNT